MQTSGIRRADFCTLRGCQTIAYLLAPLRGAFTLPSFPVVCAMLRPPATIFQPFGLPGFPAERGIEASASCLLRFLADGHH